MQIVNISTMKAMITHAGVRKRRPLAFWGRMGIGKSEGIQQSAAEHDAVLVDIRLSQYESVDFRGIPDVSSAMTVWNMPATVPFKGNHRFNEDRQPIFLFLDEINSADPSVAAVAYQLVNDRRVGEHMLMDNVVVLGAGNLDDDRGVTNKFPAPLANRFTHAQLVHDIKAWSVWAQRTNVDHRLIGFLNFRSELLHTYDPNKPVKAFASPRTWSFVASDFADDAIPGDVKQALMSGSVGEGPAVELMGWLDIMDAIVPIEEIIANPEGVKVETRLDLQWAMATHVAGNMAKDNADALHRFLKRLEPEMVVMAWTLAINRDESITETNAFLNEYALQYRSIFTG